MNKIMFNDKYGLTQAVLEGRKTKTRRIIPASVLRKADDYRVEYYNGTLDALSEKEALEQLYFVEKRLKPPYQVGEVVAIAQSYSDVAKGGYSIDSRYDAFRTANWGDGEDGALKSSAGWSNKMFVRADLMPNHIRITNEHIERLQDISESDIKAEGIDYVNGYSESYFFGFGVKTDKGWIILGNTPREAFAALIDKISGKGVFQSNPFVFAYDFGLN